MIRKLGRKASFVNRQARLRFCFSKVYVSILLISIMLLIAGCGSSGNKQSTLSYNFKQGISEVTITPIKDAPPSKIYPNSAFSLILNVENGAGYPVNKLEVSLVGINGKYFGFDKLIDRIDNFEGKSMINPLGGQQYLEFKGFANGLYENSEQYIGNYFVKADYDSSFEFMDSVCVNPSLYDVYSSGCKTESRKSYSGQGAPISITQIEEIIRPSQGKGAEIEFRMQVANRGRGKLTELTFLTAKLGNQVVDCNFNGQKDSKAMNFTANKQDVGLVCKLKIDSSSSYTSTLYAAFDYKYSLEQRYSLNIVK